MIVSDELIKAERLDFLKKETAKLLLVFERK